MKFEKLDDAAKEAARMWWRSCNPEAGWWDDIFAEASTAAALMGLAIYDSPVRTIGGQRISKLEIHFDVEDNTCTFSGQLHVADMHGCLDKILDRFTMDASLHAIARQAEDCYSKIAAEQVKRRLMDMTPNDANVAGVIRVDDSAARGSSYVDPGIDIAMPTILELDTFLNAFAAWVLAQLVHEDTYLSSDEYVDRTLIANEYNFDQYGHFK